MADDIPPPPPPPPPAPNVPRAAYVEEYNEEDQASRPETRQTANISSKRSKPDVSHIKPGRDEFSDSGYSSHTAATPASSAPSSLESKTGPNPPKIQQNTAASKRKPVNAGKTLKSKSHSPEKPQPSRTQSKAKKEKPTEAPKQKESKPKAKSKPLLGGLFSSKQPPPERPPVQRVVQDAPKPVPVRPRPSTSQSAQQPRPLSYHAGAVPMYISPPVIQPSYPPAALFSSPSYPPLQPSYFPPLPQHISPSQDFYAPPLSSYPLQPRPPSRQWPQGQYPSSRPQSYYGTPSEPMVEYGQGPVPTTIAPGMRPLSRQPSHRERPKPSPEEYPARPEDYYTMRPPPPPPKISTKIQPDQRPPMVRHAHTTSDAHVPSRNHRSEHEEGSKSHTVKGSPIKQSFTEHERMRRPAAGVAKRSDDSLPAKHVIDRGADRVNSENREIRQKRRASMYGHESRRDIEGKVEAAEAYQASHKSTATPNLPSIETLARKKKSPGSSSETSSRHSGKSGKSRTSREGSEVKSRRPSTEIRNSNEKDGLNMQFNPSQGINIAMKGGMEGRTISLRQSRDSEGQMELGIGSRGRTVGSRPPVAGREKSRRRYSYTDDGQGVKEVERPASSSRPPRSSSYREERGLMHLGRTMTMSSIADSIQEEYEPRVVRETYITRSRSRRDSRSGYSYF